MEQKKTWKADLESKRNTFFLIGLVIALGIALSAFEWKTQPKKSVLTGGIPVDVTEDIVIPVTHEPKATPPPPAPPVIEIIHIVPNSVVVGDPLIDDTEPTDIIPIDLPPVANTVPDENMEQIYINFIDEPAQFPGGDKALYKYISDHVKYPVIAQENGIYGKVYLKFVVDEEGNPINVEVARTVDPSLDAEALRVIKSLPRFKPGRQAGKYVKVYYTAVINFTLQ